MNISKSSFPPQRHNIWVSSAEGAGLALIFWSMEVFPHSDIQPSINTVKIGILDKITTVKILTLPIGPGFHLSCNKLNRTLQYAT